MSEHNPNEQPEAQGPDSRTLKRVGVGAAVIAVAVVGLGIASRIHATNELKQVAADGHGTQT